MLRLFSAHKCHDPKAKVIKYAGDALVKKSIAEKIGTEKNALEKIKSAIHANARDI